MAKLKESIYLVLAPSRREPFPNDRDIRAVREFKVDRHTKNRPTTKQGEIAVKVNITIDASLFDKIAPVVDVELEEGDVFANVLTSVALNAEQDDDHEASVG